MRPKPFYLAQPSSTPSKKSIEAAVTEQITNSKMMVSEAEWKNIKDLEDTSESSKQPETLGESLDMVMEVDDVFEQQPPDSFEAVENESLTDSDNNDDDDDDNQSDSDSDSDDDSSNLDPAAAIGQAKQAGKQFSDRTSISTRDKRFKNLVSICLLRMMIGRLGQLSTYTIASSWTVGKSPRISLLK